ncbi:hypothetical protein [Nonomuraea sp. N2-4H]|uniref:hypothetical protein n=1 Tax=Nonomuraea sp. N2-4H TaxID=3128898 RepID=UPI0038739B2C
MTNNPHRAEFTWNAAAQRVELSWRAAWKRPSIDMAKTIFDKINAREGTSRSRRRPSATSSTSSPPASEAIGLSAAWPVSAPPGHGDRPGRPARHARAGAALTSGGRRRPR